MKPTKILYVEDEPFLGKIVKESLESRQYQVNMVADGLLALPAFEQNKPDICILDVMLPNKDGFTIGKEIRKKNATIPILFLTAKSQTEDLVKGFSVGGNDYIKKPFSIEELIVRVENLLALTGKDNEEEGDVFQIGEYDFYSKRYELTNGETIQKLSYREAQLLEILIKNRNQTTQRKTILQKIWGDDSFFNSRNLDVYIRKLRKYLAQDERVKIITLKGVGYCFVVE